MGIILPRSFRSGLLATALSSLLFGAVPISFAQIDTAFQPKTSAVRKPFKLSSEFPDQPSMVPAFTIPVGPLGYAPPGPAYMGSHTSLLSIDFLNENLLLFTFHVPGLLSRDPNNSDDDFQRHIRALVISLPDGKVQANALWTVHDRDRYLWVLHDGRFLFRDQNSIQIGDASLTLKPFRQFSAPLVAMQVDPSQNILVTTTREPSPAAKTAAAQQPPAPAAASVAPQAAPATAPSGANPPATPAAADPPKPVQHPDFVVRATELDTNKVVHNSPSSTIEVRPVRSDGFLESVHKHGLRWTMTLDHFDGANYYLGEMDSTCQPTVDPIAPTEILVTACDLFGGWDIVAMSTRTKLGLWEYRAAFNEVYPRLILAKDGLRLVRETVALQHPIRNVTTPINQADIKGQIVRVFDAVNGKLQLETPVSPVFDAGGNFAISPSGNRIVVLNAGQLQFFDLPAPAQPPPAPKPQPAKK